MVKLRLNFFSTISFTFASFIVQYLFIMRGRPVLIGCAILFGCVSDLDGGERLSNHHLANKPTCFGRPFSRFPSMFRSILSSAFSSARIIFPHHRRRPPCNFSMSTYVVIACYATDSTHHFCLHYCEATFILNFYNLIIKHYTFRAFIPILISLQNN